MNRPSFFCCTRSSRAKMRAEVNDCSPGTGVVPWSLAAARYSKSLELISQEQRSSADAESPVFAPGKSYCSSVTALSRVSGYLAEQNCNLPVENFQDVCPGGFQELLSLVPYYFITFALGVSAIIWRRLSVRIGESRVLKMDFVHITNPKISKSPKYLPGLPCPA